MRPDKKKPIDDIPRGDAEGFRRHLRSDATAGFLVFLIALPLCLGISFASGFPPIAGIFTAIVGAILTTFLSNSEMTIKGPAAGMIVVVLGCVTAFGGDGMSGGWTEVDMAAYRKALAVAVVAGVLQVIFGMFRAGILSEFFPIAAVHGMLAAIGVIIISKQVPVALGVTAKGEPLELLRHIPQFIQEANPRIALIGTLSILAMFTWPWVVRTLRWLRKVPSPVVVLVVAIPLGMYFNLTHTHQYTFRGETYEAGKQFLVDIPDRVLGMFSEIALPDFSALSEPVAYQWILMFFLIGSLETLLSANAVDFLDPYRRKADMNRDIIAVGCANTVAAGIGGLPMISEIVRSRANIDAGAKTRFANMWHGVFMLLSVAFVPMVLLRIPLAALAAMLIYTGFRLAHPAEFLNAWKTGREQLLVFVVTLIAVLATDILVGIGIGIATECVVHIVNGAPLSAMFRRNYDVVAMRDDSVEIHVRGVAVFSNWIPLRRQIERVGLSQERNVILDLSRTTLVDHTVMDKLHLMKREFDGSGLRLQVVGLENHQAFSGHAQAARKRAIPTHSPENPKPSPEKDEARHEETTKKPLHS